MKRVLIVLASILLLASSVKAQNFYYPGWYLGVQGGANYNTSKLWNVGNWKHVNPNAALNLGYDFTPVFGLRGSLSGPVGNFPIKDAAPGRFNYAQLGLDLETEQR